MTNFSSTTSPKEPIFDTKRVEISSVGSFLLFDAGGPACSSSHLGRPETSLFSPILHREELYSQQARTEGCKEAPKLRGRVQFVLIKDEHSDADPAQHHKGLVNRDAFQLVIHLHRHVQELQLCVRRCNREHTDQDNHGPVLTEIPVLQDGVTHFQKEYTCARDKASEHDEEEHGELEAPFQGE